MNVDEIHKQHERLALQRIESGENPPALTHYLARNLPVSERAADRADAIRRLAERAVHGTGSVFGGGISVGGVFDPVVENRDDDYLAALARALIGGAA